MSSRRRFISGLVLVDLTVLLVAWNTWCAESSSSYSWSSPVERMWNGLIAGHDVGTFAWTALALFLFTAGLVRIVDAFAWTEATTGEQSNRAMHADGGSAAAGDRPNR